MRRTKRKAWWVLLPAVALLLLASITLQRAVPAVAESGGRYALPWNTIDGGGAMFSFGGRYHLGGTIGQPDAGVLAGGRYTLVGGFWGGVPAPVWEYKVYLPIVLRGH